MTLATARRISADSGIRPRPTNPSADASWSINHASIALLSDLGLSVKQIVRYLSMNSAEVGESLYRPS